MKKLKMSFVYLFLLVTFITLVLADAQAQSPQQTLNQYMADLQKNPADFTLREKIIKHVQTMRPTPAVPEQVDELLGQVSYIMKTAKAAADYTDAATAYRKVLLLAPWVAPYYFDLGTVLENAGEKAFLLCMVTKDLAGKYSAGNISKELAPIGGGSRPDMAQAGGTKPKNLGKVFPALEKLRTK